MIYTPKTKNVIAAVTYGSHLYGTNGPSSDFDFKAISLPSYRDMLLAKNLKVEKYKYDEHGTTIPEDQSMPANGYEAEHTPLQKFVRDYLGGQAYAVELVYAILQGAHLKHRDTSDTMVMHRAGEFTELCLTLHRDFKHKNVQGMVGFAVKQTFDYVRRGERLNAAREVRRHLHDLIMAVVNYSLSPRLDTLFSSLEGRTVLDELAARTGLKIGASVNNNKVQRTLELNGRSYLETTGLEHLANAVDKLIDQYGDRSTRASETDVDWKSMSHAVRVYQQVLELLETGFIKFPRPNAEQLKTIKNGEMPLEQVKDLLRDLDDQVQVAVEASTLPQADEAMHARADDMLYAWLEHRYSLERFGA